MTGKKSFDWKWSEGLKPSGRSMEEILESMRSSVIESNGRLDTAEEAIRITDEIREAIRAEENE